MSTFFVINIMTDKYYVNQSDQQLLVTNLGYLMYIEGTFWTFDKLKRFEKEKYILAELNSNI